MSGKRKAEGIALLSLYNDEDMDVDDDMEEEEEEAEAEAEAEEEGGGGEEGEVNNEEQKHEDEMQTSSSSPPKEAKVQQMYSVEKSRSPSPAKTVDKSESRPAKGGLGIVDYAHDETAMSPEPEEGEIVSTGLAVLGQELQVENGRTPPGMVQLSSPGITSTLLHASLPEAHAKPESDIQSVDLVTNNEHEVAVSAETNDLAKMEVQQTEEDPLADFLPPPPTSKCSDELQNRINRYLSLKTAGRSFNEELRKSKGYRNPDFLQRAVKHQDIDQIGSCFKKDIFDPHGYDPSDYYDALTLELKREFERREQEKKKNQRVDFVPGGVQSGSVQQIPKPVVQLIGGQKIPVVGAAAVSATLQSATSSVDTTKLENRQNKKSKWDKVDGDRRNPLPPGAQDAMVAASAHAALLSAANAGAGYTAFAQQKRKEAEEKRSNERRSEKKS